MVWLGGGPATIDMWDLKPDAPAEIRGEFKPIPTNVDGIQICEHLPKVAKVCDKATLVRSLNHTIPAHGPATVFMQTGNKPTPAVQYPVLGSLTSRLLSQEQGVPPFVSFGEMRNGNAGGYLGTAYNPFVIEGDGGKGKNDKANFRVRGIQLPNGFTLDQLDDRDSLMNDFDDAFRANDKAGDLVDGLDAFHKKALEILRSDKTKNAFDLTREKQELRENLWPQRLRPGRVGGPAAGGGRRAFRDHQHGRLGHARQKLRGAVEATSPAAGPDALRADPGSERPRDAG